VRHLTTSRARIAVWVKAPRGTAIRLKDPRDDPMRGGPTKHPDPKEVLVTVERLRAPETPTPICLVLTPDADVHLQLAETLSPGCAVLWAPDGAFQHFAPGPRSPGVAVLDDERGAKAILSRFAEARERWPALRAVALVGSRDPDRVAELATLYGSLLLKPFERARLVALVQHHIRLSSMSSGVRRLSEASAVRRLRGEKD
jgi:hypothetical protein